MKKTMEGHSIQGGAAMLVAGTVNIAYTPLSEHLQYAGGLLGSVQSPTPPDGATCIVVQAISQNVRWALQHAIGDASPTASKGFRITAGNDPMLIPFAPGCTIQFIQETAGAVLEFQWGC